VVGVTLLYALHDLKELTSFHRCNWDIEELKAKKEKITADPAFLNMGMNGWPYQA
jgi:hypothetical protein